MSAILNVSYLVHIKELCIEILFRSQSNL